MCGVQVMLLLYPINTALFFHFQFLSADGELVRSKSRSSQRLFKLGSSHDIRKAKFKEPSKLPSTQRRIPLVEALFLPEFPLHGDLDELGYEVLC